MKKKIYLDYAATTPVDPEVLVAMNPYFTSKFGNPGSIHSFGQEVSRTVYLSRRKIAQAIQADYQEIIFTGSATEANNLALRGVINKFLSISRAERAYFYRISRKTNRNKPFGRNTVEIQRPRIIVSSIEHESILETAKDLESEGVEVIYLPVSREGFVDLKKLKDSLNERTVLVSVMYANNEIGTIEPIAKISEIIGNFREKIGKQETYLKKDSRFAIGTLPIFHTDAVQALQYLDCSVNKLGIDLMTLSAHKIYGPKGIGALYVRHATSDKKNHSMPHVSSPISPIITGGGQEWNLRSGTENVPYIVGFGKAVELVLRFRKKEYERIQKLQNYLYRKILAIYPKSKLNGTSLDKNRLPNNLNIWFPEKSGEEMLVKLDLMGVSVSAGSACSSRSLEPSYVLETIGLTQKQARESLRFTLGRGTTKTQIDSALKVLKKVLL